MMKTQQIRYATWVAALFAATSSFAPRALRAQSVIDTLSIRADTRFLADDLLRGRGTGTEGERIAAAYIESRLIAIGLRGAGSNGAFRLPVPLRTAIIRPTSGMTITRSDEVIPFTYGRDFIMNTGGVAAFHDFAGTVLFVGAPSHALQLMRAAPSLSGQVIAFNGPLGSAAGDIVPLLITRGAAGVMILLNDSAQYDLYVRSRGDRRFFAAVDVADPVWQPSLPVVLASPAVARLLVASPATLTTTQPLPALVGSHAVAVRVESTLLDVPADNVGGIIRGTNPTLRDEYVVYTAHYDHLGVSTPDARGDSIYNGFSDNAAGTAMLLAIAQAFQKSPPARSVAFLFFTGEERGLLGSSYLAAHPPFPLDRIRAVINLDAGAPPAPPVTWRIAGGVESAALGQLAADVAARNGWRATPSTASPNSDYWPFLSRGVPAIFIVPGDEWQNTTTAQRDELRRVWDRYHQAGDHWNALFPFAGLERYAAFAYAVGAAAAGH